METIHFVPIYAPQSVSFTFSSVFWSIPPLETVKINVDAVVFESSRHFGVGVVARNNLGIVLLGLRAFGCVFTFHCRVICVFGGYFDGTAKLLT